MNKINRKSKNSWILKRIFNHITKKCVVTVKFVTPFRNNLYSTL